MKDKDTGDLFPQTGKELRDAGAQTVIAHSGEWKHVAYAAILQLRMKEGGFTSEDLTEKVGMPPNHPNAVGAVILRASRDGSIIWTGRVVSSKRPTCHAALLKVWTA